MCNTPDNSIEIWDTDVSMPAFVTRVPVALEPCSVVWDGERAAFLSLDFLSDSVTRVTLSHAGTPSPANLRFQIDRTVNVVDEPQDAVLSPDGTRLFIGAMTPGIIREVDPVTLLPIHGGGFRPMRRAPDWSRARRVAEPAPRG